MTRRRYGRTFVAVKDELAIFRQFVPIRTNWVHKDASVTTGRREFTSPDEPDLFHEPLAPEVLAAVVGSASDRTHPTEARRNVDALLAGLRPTKPQEQTTPTEVDGAKQAASSGAWGFRSSPDPSALL